MPDEAKFPAGGGHVQAPGGRRLSSFHQGRGRKIPFPSKLRTGETEGPAGNGSPDPGIDRSAGPESRRATGAGGSPQSVETAPEEESGSEKPSPRRGLLIMVLAIAAGVLGWCVLCGFGIGYWMGRSLVRDARVIAALSSETEARVSEAMEKLRAGSSDEALRILQAARSASPETPSLAYLSALAALQAGDSVLAEKLAKESIALGERVSDALALRAVLQSAGERGRPASKSGRPGVRAEQVLQGAIAADPANPYPYVELSSLLRAQGRTDDAMAALRSASTRLPPSDSHTVVAVTLALMELEKAGMENLPEGATASGGAVSLFSSAYAALRRGEISDAAAILKQCRTLLSPDLFDYLMNDPALRRFMDQKELKEFFGR